MNIVVCMKQVPDTEVERSLRPGENTVDRSSVAGVINYLDGFAIEVTVRRVTDDGYAVVTGSLPAVVSAVEKINEPWYPSFKGIMAAKKKPVQTLTLDDVNKHKG